MIKINKALLLEVKGGAELYGAILELDSTKMLLTGHIEDLELELKASRAALMKTVTKIKKGEDVYRSIHNKSINLTAKK